MAIGELPSLLATQCGHSICALFVRPQPEHVLSAVTSLSALPAICLCLFFMCDVFFFGTARNTDSQMSDTSDGIGMTIAGSSDSRHLSSNGLLTVGPNRVFRAIGRKAWRKDALGATRKAIVKSRLLDSEVMS